MLSSHHDRKLEQPTFVALPEALPPPVDHAINGQGGGVSSTWSRVYSCIRHVFDCI